MIDLIQVGAHLYGDAPLRLHVSGPEARGQHSVTETHEPLHASSGRHIHALEDETFLLLDGEVEFWIDGRTRRVKAGESIFIPHGVAHSYTVLSLAAWIVVSLAPAGKARGLALLSLPEAA